MTVSSTINREQYVTDGVSTDFTIHFGFFEAASVKATLVASDGTKTPLVLGTDYTVVGGAGAGGTLSAVPALAAGIITIYRDLTFTQESKYVENDPFPAARAMNDLDLAAMRDQQLQDGQARSLSFPPTVGPDVSAELPNPTATYFLRWNDTGDALENVLVIPSTSVVAASETQAGIAEIATQVETNAGTDDARMITAKKLAIYVAAAIAAIFTAAKSITALWTFTNTTNVVLALTDNTNIAWNVANGNIATVTLGGNRTLSNPTNVVAGGYYQIQVKQDATGGRTLALGGAYNTGATTLTLTATGGKIDVLTFYAVSSSILLLVGVAKGF